jgi:hypothetical protein
MVNSIFFFLVVIHLFIGIFSLNLLR